MPVAEHALELPLGQHSAPRIPEAAGIGLIIGVDRLLDMFRTAVNIWATQPVQKPSTATTAATTNNKR